MANTLLKIGAVAKASGVSVKTIRFYCDQGVLAPTARSDSHYRLFSADVLDDIAMIRTLRAMELPLDCIRSVLQARRSGLCTCADLQATIRDKVTEIYQRIDDLRALEHDLNTLLAGWESCDGR